MSKRLTAKQAANDATRRLRLKWRLGLAFATNRYLSKKMEELGGALRAAGCERVYSEKISGAIQIGQHWQRQ